MWVVVALSVIVGILRFFVPSHNLSLPGTYEAFAHIAVGSLLTMVCFSCFSKKERVVAGITLAIISGIELFKFLEFVLNEI